MSNTPFNRDNVPRILAAGAALAVIGVVAFILLWVMMGNVATLPRLLVAMCIPPAIIAAILGVYILVTRAKDDQA